MKWQIHKNPLGLLEINMEKGESVTAESGALVFIQGDVEVKTSTKIMEQGLFNRFKSIVLGGESIFLNDYIAKSSCSIGLAGAFLGDIEAIYVDGSYILQSRSYIASTGDIKMDTKFQGLIKGIFGTELFMLKLVGNGNVFLNAYGGIVKREVKDGERIVIDNYHLVAMDGNTNYRVVKIGSWKTFLLGGEAIGIEVRGPSTLYIQSRSEMEIKDELTRLLELDKLKKEQQKSIWDKSNSDSKPWFQPNI